MNSLLFDFLEDNAYDPEIVYCMTSFKSRSSSVPQQFVTVAVVLSSSVKDTGDQKPRFVYLLFFLTLFHWHISLSLKWIIYFH